MWPQHGANTRYFGSRENLRVLSSRLADRPARFQICCTRSEFVPFPPFFHILPTDCKICCVTHSECDKGWQAPLHELRQAAAQCSSSSSGQDGCACQKESDGQHRGRGSGSLLDMIRQAVMGCRWFSMGLTVGCCCGAACTGQRNRPGRCFLTPGEAGWASQSCMDGPHSILCGHGSLCCWQCLLSMAGSCRTKLKGGVLVVRGCWLGRACTGLHHAPQHMLSGHCCFLT